MTKTLKDKRQELFDFHIKNPASCNNQCIKSLKDSVEQQDEEFIKTLKREIIVQKVNKNRNRSMYMLELNIGEIEDIIDKFSGIL